MAVEIELKLSTQAQAGPIIVEQLLPMLKVKVEQSEVELSNSYFDSPDRDFRRNDMGLRIRGCQHLYEQTLKTAGKGVAGLQQRPEYNVSLGLFKQNAPEKPILTLFPADIWPANFDVAAAQQNITCLFSTHFTRSQYLLTWPDTTQVELVWDRGQVQASGRSQVISEVELELKKGSVDILFSLARQLAELMPVTIGLLSKAARGYRLMDEAKAGVQTPVLRANVSCNEEEITQADTGVLLSYLTQMLDHWQNMSVDFPLEHKAIISWAEHLAGVLTYIDKIVQQLKHQEPSLNLTLRLSGLPELQQRLSELHSELVTSKQGSLQQVEAEQALLALVADKQTIILQLELMQYLSGRA